MDRAQERGYTRHIVLGLCRWKGLGGWKYARFTLSRPKLLM